MKMRVIFAVVVSLLASCSGTKMFTIYTDPEGADISINGQRQFGKTPLTLKLSQEKDLGIVASKPGYETAALTVPTRTNWWLALLWTKSDPRAQYIEENDVMLKLKKIPTAQEFRPEPLPRYTGGGGVTAPKAPALRPMPNNLQP